LSVGYLHRIRDVINCALRHKASNSLEGPKQKFRLRKGQFDAMRHGKGPAYVSGVGLRPAHWLETARLRVYPSKRLDVIEKTLNQLPQTKRLKSKGV